VQSLDPNLRDDLLLAALMLVIAIPRVALAIVADHPIGVEGTLAVICCALALLVIARRIRRRSRGGHTETQARGGSR
jgi:membrane protein implicated in regulation of membrane protease activity